VQHSQQWGSSRSAAAVTKTAMKTTTSVHDYSQGLLKWWRVNGMHFPVWALAARIAFAITPNSASCERVFAMLDVMFDEEQRGTLIDALQTTYRRHSCSPTTSAVLAER